MESNKSKLTKKAKIRIAAVVCAVALIVGIVAADLIRSSASAESTFVAMGTVINLKITGKDCKNTRSLVQEEITVSENDILSRNSSASEISRINASAGEAVYVSKETSEYISRSSAFSKLTDGAFDITVGEITKLWDFGGDNQRVPSENEINSLLPYVGYQNININGNAVKIAEKQSLDLGAVGKGITCDRVNAVLRSTNTKSAVISIGGSLLLYGDKTFTIGIINPNDDTKSMGTLRLSDTCISTSGSYEKHFNKDGKEYHHILDATTGYPADSKVKSVTVVCSSGLDSDALSTVCFLLGYEKSLSILNEYEAEAVFIFNDNSVRITDGLKDSFELTDSSFKVI
ncbi:MAG: FAD:protein FMN transferase [Clostridia bacterium]|nr:FAD:protein FMN transferase [Clostridia bacterium]